MQLTFDLRRLSDLKLKKKTPKGLNKIYWSISRALTRTMGVKENTMMKSISK